jgi:bacteriocin-like protein
LEELSDEELEKVTGGSAGAYIAGFGFAVGSVLKFKAHKDNPT